MVGGGGGLFYFRPYERGAYYYIFEQIHVNVANFTITPVTRMEQEIGYVSPFLK